MKADVDRPGDILDAKAATRLRVLDCIRDAGSIPRIDIANALNSSPATVTAATSALLAAGLIVEEEQPNHETARRGRPKVMLRLKSDALIVAGLKVARGAISVVLLDFAGIEVASHTRSLPQAMMAPGALMVEIRKAVNAACGTIDRQIEDLAGISVGLAGFVNAERNFVHWSSSVRDRNVDFGPLFSEYLPCPAFLDNDANLVAKAEQLFGHGRGVPNFIVVTIEHGVGLGVVLDGRLYRGERGCGAEFGHMKVQLDGAMCQCGQRGCLEAYVGDYALIREVGVGPDADALRSMADIFSAADGGHVLAQATLDRAGQVFGMGLANLVNLFDPELIILSGTGPRIDHLSAPPVLNRLRQSAVAVDAPLPEVRLHRWADTMWAKGAAAYGIERVSILQVMAMERRASRCSGESD